MAARDVLRYPHPLLKTRCQDIMPADPAVQDVVRDMLDTLDASPGVALAAPQIGYAVRAIVVDVSRDKREEHRRGHGRVVLLNPVLLACDEMHVVREGCLSVPDFTANVMRGGRAVVQGLTPQGETQVLEALGFEALAFQHEIDHLDGTLFLDRVASLKRDLFPRKQR
ncbi:MAG: peptide deformylase [Dehalococcoidia bacterium]|nr:peptide deformylase [Dehalococcoidia bacterium]